MLANQYYMIGKYQEAAPIYERELKENVIDVELIARVIICHTISGNFERAINLLQRVIKIEPYSNLNFKIDSDICQCPELISKIVNGNITYPTTFNKNLALGILWIFSDPPNALSLLNLAYKQNSDPILRKLIALISKQIHSQNNLWS